MDLILVNVSGINFSDEMDF